MQNIQEGSKGIACDIPNLGLVHEGLVEEIRSVLFLDLFLVVLLPALGLLLLHSRPGDVESHFDQLVGARSCLASAILGASGWLATCTIAFGGRERKLHGHLILSCEVGVRDLGVGNLKRGSVLNAEGQFGFGEVCLAPVPTAQGVLAVLDVDSIPNFEGLGQSFKILTR